MAVLGAWTRRTIAEVAREGKLKINVEDGVLLGHDDDIGVLVVPEGIVEIAKNAFAMRLVR